MNTVIWIIIALILALLLGAVIFFLWALYQRQQQLLKRIDEQNVENRISMQSAAAQNDDRFDFLISQVQDMNKSFGRQDHVLDVLADQTKQMASTMSNAKMRGSWGEVQMEMLIEACLGQSDTLFQRQVTLNNGKIADGVFFLPGTERLLCIDSKFPLDNFVRMESDETSNRVYEKELIKNVKKHIQDIHNKYITEQTEPYALMFIPSEALYQFICSKSDLLQSAWDAHVLIVSPTTLSGVLFSLKGAVRDFYRASHMEEIEQSLKLVSKKMEDFEGLAAKAARQSRSLADSLTGLENAASRMNSHIEQALEGVSHGRTDSQG